MSSSERRRELELIEHLKREAEHERQEASRRLYRAQLLEREIEARREMLERGVAA